MDRDGIIISSTGNSYTVRDDRTGDDIDAVLRGRLRLKGVRSTNPVVVGDRVRYELDQAGNYTIEEVLPRRNYIIRRSSNLSKESHIIAANLDQAILVVSLFHPSTKTEFIDRFLVTCEAYGIPAILVLNKTDLLAGDFEQVQREFIDVYKNAGYEVIGVSASTGDNIEQLRNLLTGKMTLLSGNSGVGKSTIINRLIPDAGARIGDISGSHNKGKHTTTFSRMYELPGGGWLIDTPGIKGFGLIEIGGKELQHFFPEFMRLAPKCQYYNCSHIHEPGCAVLDALSSGDISEERYINYLKILEEDDKHRK